MARNWQFTFPPKMMARELEARDLFDLIVRAVAQGQLDSVNAQRVAAPSTTADMVRAGLDSNQQLLG